MNGEWLEGHPDDTRWVLVSVLWADEPCVAYWSGSRWFANQEFVSADSGVWSDLSTMQVEGWMDYVKPKWVQERDAEAACSPSP